MKLEIFKISNLGCYKHEIAINVSDLTTIVWENDTDKSAILDAGSVTRTVSLGLKT